MLVMVVTSTPLASVTPSGGENVAVAVEDRDTASFAIGPASSASRTVTLARERPFARTRRGVADTVDLSAGIEGVASGVGGSDLLEHPPAHPRSTIPTNTPTVII